MSLERERCGDWLLEFDGRALPASGRTSAPWECVFHHGEARLWLQRPPRRRSRESGRAEHWYGSPWRSLGPTEAGERLWIQGEIFAPDRLAWRLARSRGETPEADPSGHFLLVHRAADGAWNLVTQRFGSLHAYRASAGGRTVVGSSFRAVASMAACPTDELDWLGLAGFFQYGFFPADRTYYPGVRVLRPGRRYRFDVDGRPLVEERWWQWRHQVDPTLGFDDAVSELDRRLRTVMADLAPGVATPEECSRPVAVPISGGLDSRSTVATLPPSASAWSYSYGWAPEGGTVDESPEIAIARQVARARRLPFEVHEVGPYLFGQLDSVLAAVEGFQNPTQSRQVAMWPAFEGRVERVIAAHWGDVWLDDMGLADPAETPRGPLDEAEVFAHATRRLRKSADFLMENLVERHLGRDSRRVLDQCLESELEAFAHLEEADYRVKAFKTEQWSWRFTLASLRAFQGAAFPRLPFYDVRLTELFERLPARFVAGRRLQVAHLKRFAPDLARVPWQVYGANLYRYRHFHTWMLPERALRKLWRQARQRVSGRGPVVERNWEAQFRGAGRAALRQSLLAPGLRLHDLLPRRAIETLLADFEARPTGSLGYQVSMLFGFSAWLERA